jgi:hypothetical protein
VLEVERLRTLLPRMVAAAAPKPVEIHANNLMGTSGLTYVEAVKCGVAVLHTAARSMANGPSVPSTESVVRNLELLGVEHGLDTSLLAPVDVPQVALKQWLRKQWLREQWLRKPANRAAFLNHAIDSAPVFIPRFHCPDRSDKGTAQFARLDPATASDIHPTRLWSMSDTRARPAFVEATRCRRAGWATPGRSGDAGSSDR